MNEMHNVFNRARLDDRQITELIGICRGLIADNVVNFREAEFLHAWLVANAGITDNPLINNLQHRVAEVLKDGILGSDEAQELMEPLQKFTGGEFEIGEVLKSCTLPLDEPPPDLRFEGARYCFTGTFAYGSRGDCENAVKRRGADYGSLTLKTNYLVIGVYATESWIHSSYGRKIERAVEMKADGRDIAIVGESHWVNYIQP